MADRVFVIHGRSSSPGCPSQQSQYPEHGGPSTPASCATRNVGCAVRTVLGSGSVPSARPTRGDRGAHCVVRNAEMGEEVMVASRISIPKGESQRLAHGCPSTAALCETPPVGCAARTATVPDRFGILSAAHVTGHAVVARVLPSDLPV